MKAYDTLKEILTTEVNPKGLAGLAMAGVMAGTGFGCTNMRTNQIDIAYNFDFKNQTQSDSRYKIERVILHGEEFYVRTREVNNETELPFEFLPFDKISRVIDLDAINPRKRVKLESEESYIPKKAEAPGTINNYVDILVLDRNDAPEYKINGIKSNIRKTDINLLGNADFNGSSVKTTEQDACYGIRKTTIFGEEYFFPHVERSQTGKKGQLDFYIVPVKGTDVRIKNMDGKVSIENDDRVYRPQAKSSIEIEIQEKKKVAKKEDTPTTATTIKSK